MGNVKPCFCSVSIHTPTKGVTGRIFTWFHFSQFQSTHPRRVWLSYTYIIINHVGFNPHTHEGCDLATKFANMSIFSFNPHTHEGCDLALHHRIIKVAAFQSTHPRRVWPNPSFLIVFTDKFQSTHPRRVWRLPLWKRRVCQFRFNPHTHEGCDATAMSKFIVALQFQSTHPRRVWLSDQMQLVLSFSFNPHTHEGCDAWMPWLQPRFRSFNPHTHEGCDFLATSSNPNHSCFNPHTHEGCDVTDMKLYT